MADTSYQTQVYRKQAALQLVTPTGTKINIESGAMITFNSTQMGSITVPPELVTSSADSVATSDIVILAGKVNSLLVAWRNAGLCTS